MNCSEIEAKLSAYLDGLLHDDERESVGRHCAECTHCRHSLEELERTKNILGQLDEVEPPSWLTESVMSRIREKEEARGWLKRLFLPLRVKVPIEALAMIFVAVLSVYIYRSTVTDMNRFDRPPESPPSSATRSVPEKTKAAGGGKEDIQKGREPGQKEKKIAAPAGGPQKPALKEIPGPPAQVGQQDNMARTETRGGGGPPVALEKRAVPGSLKDELLSPAAIPPSPAGTERSKSKAMAAREEQISEYRAGAAGSAQGGSVRITVKVRNVPDALSKVRGIMTALSARDVRERTENDSTVISCLMDPKVIPELKDRIAAIAPGTEGPARSIGSGDAAPQRVEVVVIKDPRDP
jgi:hypothetical protein